MIIVSQKAMEVARASAIAVGLIDTRAQMRFAIDHLYYLKHENLNHLNIIFKNKMA